MPSLFSGIHIALRTLLSHQQSIQVIEHNVANANRPGYRRQKAVLAPGLPYAVPGFNRPGSVGQMGTGVLVERVERFNLEFFDGRYRNEIAESKRWKSQESILHQVESTLVETSETGLLTDMDEFWAGWQSLSVDPANLALRADLRVRALTMTQTFNGRAIRLRQIRKDEDSALIQRAQEINNLATEVAQLNGEISRVFSVGDQPNDLLDERDRALDRLAELSGAVSSLESNSEVMVSIGGHALVVGHETFSLTTTPDVANDLLVRIDWVDGQPYNGTSGELAGMVYARDTLIVNQQNALDNLAANFIIEVNALHSTGFGLNDAVAPNRNFFDAAFTDAESIRLDADILSDLANIATAASANAPGDGSIAMQIAEIKNDDTVMAGGTATLNQYYAQQAVALGLEVVGANTRSKDRMLVAESLDIQRESLSGVSLDEEAANLVQSQRAYEAAARMLTAFDDMIDRIINQMGRVGR